MKIQGKRTKPMVDGMYTRHPQYSKSPLDETQKRSVQHFQAQRCESRRRARINGYDILSKRLV